MYTFRAIQGTKTGHHLRGISQARPDQLDEEQGIEYWAEMLSCEQFTIEVYDETQSGLRVGIFSPISGWREVAEQAFYYGHGYNPSTPISGRRTAYTHTDTLQAPQGATHNV